MAWIRHFRLSCAGQGLGAYNELQQHNDLTLVENYHREDSCYTAVQVTEQFISRDYEISMNEIESMAAVAYTSDVSLPCLSVDNTEVNTVYIHICICNVVIPDAVLLLVWHLPLYSLA